ncbi:hypothetical protein N7462_004312 [Penicillium macrosclerotiorum]|uniref:uncharacterized protein n=1 Tax=Penicillium macrosclerotiorum TaxID=303699 RepID=UPI00254962C2|nr:uncharacterized protein N7462_004312 [Penicillium macrosclerotiorum]KAJ5689920.1 hypothetical protein N7462_004312 [Penicillium macrosclerotiorum]
MALSLSALLGLIWQKRSLPSSQFSSISLGTVIDDGDNDHTAIPASRLHRRKCNFRLKRALCGTLLIIILLLAYKPLITQLRRFRFRRDLNRYDIGFEGFAPSRDYHSFQLDSPKLAFIQTDARCNRDYIFLAPNGASIPKPGPVILDADGELIWRMWEGLEGVTQDFRVQRYKDEDFLTFWVGNEIDGKKQGHWYMLDSSYKVRYTLSPAGNFTTGDMHEFHLTPEGTALVVVYDAIPADLSSVGGPLDGWILDGVVQEIDIETGGLRFEWRASEHFSVEDTFHGLAGCQETDAAAFAGCGNSPTSSFDFFHLNSVEKDQLGNYLVSSRYTHTISGVSGKDGSLLWTLGGKSNQFQDLSANGSATSFAWQHHARWYGSSSITLFDNAVEDNSDTSIESRGLIIDLDIEKRQANVRAEFLHPQKMEAVSLGSMQILEGSENIFIGWGHSAAFTEFAPDGSVLCDFHYGPSALNTFGRLKSYRVFRGRWVGYPTEPINVAVNKNAMYVSWNGATEVDRWQLEVQRDDRAGFDTASQFFKTGFETKIMIPPSLQLGSLIRIQGLDFEGNVLGSSDVVEIAAQKEISSFSVNVLIIFFGAMILAAVIYFVRRRRIGRPQDHDQYQLLPVSN